jgi:hypothetical protein
MLIIFVVLLIVLLLGTLPVYSYSRSWGYYPSGGILLFIVVLLIVIWLTGYRI